MKDRFTQAYSELTDNNPYVCTTCETKYGHPTIEHLGGETAIRGDFEMGTKDTECILFCDPMPFGD
ncbi:MAG: hypothetical protein FIB02_11780 [Desulfuromonas sp.]|nr:hypothetical protein [Desulfuromonas sp.]